MVGGLGPGSCRVGGGPGWPISKGHAVLSGNYLCFRRTAWAYAYFIYPGTFTIWIYPEPVSVFIVAADEDRVQSDAG